MSFFRTSTAPTPQVPGSVPAAHRPGAMPAPVVVYGLLISGWVAFLIYGSLLPFQFVLPRHLDHLSGWLDVAWWAHQFHPPWFGWHRLMVSDVPINVLLYVPVGLLLRLQARARRRRVLWQLAMPVIVAGLLSLFLEAGQVVEPVRVASWQDWWTNLLGGAIGALVLAPLAVHLRQAIFSAYCRTATMHRTMVDRWQRRGVHPLLGAGLGLVAAAALGLAAAGHSPGHHATVNWLPFYDQFFWPYDLAAKWVLWDLLCWAAVGAWLLAALMMVTNRRRWGKLAAAMLALALARQTIFYALGRTADSTDLVLALAAVGVLGLAAWAVRRAVAVSCRRKQPRQVSFERRRTAHAYPTDAADP